MDDQRFDAISRVLATGFHRRGALRALVTAALLGSVAPKADTALADKGTLSQHCKAKVDCESPLVCIFNECDHCKTSGECEDGWCCDGYFCENRKCVACKHSKSLGVTVEGCGKEKEDGKKKKGKKGKKH